MMQVSTKYVNIKSGLTSFLFVLAATCLAQGPPSIADQTYHIIDTVENGDIIVEVEASDPDGDDLTYSILSGNTGDAFFLDEFAGVITVADRLALDFSTPNAYELIVQVSDGTDNRSATITIVLNNAPTFSWEQSSFEFSEEEVWFLGIPVEDGESDDLQVAIISGDDDGLLTVQETTIEENDSTFYEIVPTDTQNGLDFEVDQTQFELTIQASDEFTNVQTSQVSISILNTNDNFPTFFDAFFSLDEDAPVGTLIGTAQASDLDGDDVIYAIESGNTGDAFQIDQISGELTVLTSEATDYDTNQEFSLVVSAFDGLNQSEAIFTVTIIQSPVPVIESQSFVISNTIEDGGLVGQVLASDPQFDELSYSIVSGNDTGLFGIETLTGNLLLNDRSALDFSTPTTYEVEVMVSDGVESSAAQITIQLNQPPLFSWENTEFEFPENEQWFLTVPVEDAELDDITVTVVSGNDESLLQLEPVENQSSAYQLTTLAEGLDFETDPQDFELTFRAVDGFLGETTSETIRISISNVNDNAPTGQNITLDIDEGLPIGSFITSVEGVDLDDDVLTYSIIGGNTDNAFTIDQASGDITVSNSSPLEFDTNPSINLIVSIADGIFNTVVLVSININEVVENSAPLVENQTFSIAENSNNQDFIGQVQASDPDGNALTFEILEGNEGDAFLINANSGELFVADGTQLDFETSPTFTLTVGVTDGELSDTAEITINLEDVDESENPLAVEQTHFVIYPNPATEKFVIEGVTYSGIALYDVTGREVKDFQLNPSHEYIISDVARGTYFLRIFTQDAVLLERIVVR